MVLVIFKRENFLGHPAGEHNCNAFTSMNNFDFTKSVYMVIHTCIHIHTSHGDLSVFLYKKTTLTAETFASRKFREQKVSREEKIAKLRA